MAAEDEKKNDVKIFSHKFQLTFNTDDNIDEMWNNMKENMQTIVNKHVPTKITSKKYQQPWFTIKTSQLARKKNRWFKKMKSNYSDRVEKKYKEIKRIAQKEFRLAHAEYIKNMICEDNKNKKLWAYIKSKKQEHIGIPDLADNYRIV